MSAEDRCVRLDIDGTIATVTIDRPKRRNAIDLTTIRALYAALDQLADDRQVRCVIVTGTGDTVFVSGADIGELRQRRRADALAGLNNRLFTAIERHPQPVIAALNGAALGGGFELALACDLRIAVEGAKLGFPETGLGIMPAAGGTQRLPKLVGLARAKELVLTGELITAAEGLAMGVVNRVVPPAELMPAARRMAERIAKKAPLAVELAKASLNQSGDMPMTTGLEMENVAQAILFESADKEEGMSAFLDKRRPEFGRR